MERLGTSGKRTLPRHVSRLMVWFKGGNIDSENTYMLSKNSNEEPDSGILGAAAPTNNNITMSSLGG